MILHVFKSNIYSGAENVVCQIIKNLSDREEFIYMAPHGPIENKLKSIGLIDKYYGIDSLTISSIKSAVEELHPDVVQAHDFTASVLCGLALKGRIPVISHIHCNPLWLKNKFHPNSISYLIASRWFSTILTVSDAVMGEYCYSDKIKCPVRTVGNPFSMKQVIDMAAGANNNERLASDILYVGRFNEAKNPLGAISIAGEYINTMPDTAGLMVRMVGDGELLQEAKSYVSEHNLDDYFSFEGFQENVYKYMANTKVLLMPSVFEGFGLVALEAMTLGIPVVCSGVGGLSGIVTCESGYICSEMNEYLAALDALLSDDKTYSEKSEASKRRAGEFDNINSYMDAMENVYKLN